MCLELEAESDSGDARIVTLKFGKKQTQPKHALHTIERNTSILSFYFI